MNRRTHNPTPRTTATRRGVANVLAMMFLVIFSSLTAAMAVVAHGNLRTADSAIKVSRAMSAAETGLIYASKQLQRESSRFVVEKGVISEQFGHDLWLGTFNTSMDGSVEILPPTEYVSTNPPNGLAEAIIEAHQQGQHSFDPELTDQNLPLLDTETGTVLVKPVRMRNGENDLYFRLRYELVADQPVVRVTSIGHDRGITRTLQVDFEIDKKIEYAIISPNRVMIGKNVRVEGPLGSRYGLVEGELDDGNGDPLVVRSDYYYLSDELNQKLDILYSQITLHDVDQDARLRPDHPTEGQELHLYPELIDVDDDEYIDDFDLFLGEFDTNGDGMVVYDDVLAANAGLGSLSVEFEDVDDQLARLVDKADPDRNDDDVVDGDDITLGYNDGTISSLDRYAKIKGRLAFAVAREPWESLHGESYQSIVQGPIVPGKDKAAATFEVGEEDLREINTSMFDESQTWFFAQASNQLESQANWNIASTPGAVFTEADARDYESVPYGSLNAYDWYRRPLYENMVFNNVTIPVGNNGLFRNCRFEGVTYIQTESDCIDVNWNYTGAQEKIENGGTVTYPPRFEGLTSAHGNDVVDDTKTLSNNIRFDGCTFLGSISGDKPNQYTHWRNKVQITGATRFYVDPEDPDLQSQPDVIELVAALESIGEETRQELAKSSIMMPGWSIDVGNFTNEQAVDPDETATVKLKGVIIAGILDVRGTADVFGTLMMTFHPKDGEGPLFYDGQVNAFNTTIGYFGPLDGDGEGTDPTSGEFEGFGEITLRYNPDAMLPDGIPWPITMETIPMSYREGGIY
ncbi:MAG: hypothetical protein CMJ32_10620 [Phycisphaerae bacterium]|nr:hypothetical protein [Phycisphaerae bacterium]